MSREIHIHLDLKMTSKFLVGAIAAGLILVFAGDLNSEYVNLTTYYPAPSGVYTQMLTTGRAYFAQSLGTGVAIGWGSTNFPAGNSLKLSVAGSAAIGTTSGFANAALTTANNPTDLVVEGRVGVGSTLVNSITESDGVGRKTALLLRGRTRIGVGNATVDVSRGRSYLFIDNSETDSVDTPCVNWPNGSVVVGVNGNPTSVCGAGQYSSFAPGVYVEGWWFQDRGGQVIASWGAAAGQFSTKVWGMGGAGNPQWLELGKNDGTMRIHCCNK